MWFLRLGQVLLRKAQFDHYLVSLYNNSRHYGKLKHGLEENQKSIYPVPKLSGIFAPMENHKTECNLFSGFIPMDQIYISYHVGKDGLNKEMVQTLVEIRFHLKSAKWLNDTAKEKIKSQYCQELTRDGFMVVKSDRTRSQLLNQADALRKLRDIIWFAVGDSRYSFTIKTNPLIKLGKEENDRKEIIRFAKDRLKKLKETTENSQSP